MRALVLTLLALFTIDLCLASNHLVSSAKALVASSNNKIKPDYILVSDKSGESVDNLSDNEDNNISDENIVESKEIVKKDKIAKLDIKKEEEEFARALLESKKKESEHGKKESKYEINKFDKYLLFLAKRILKNHKVCRTRKECLKRDLKTIEVARNSQRSVSTETYYTRSYNYGRQKQERKKVTVRDKQILAAIESMREEIKELPDQELFNISPIIFKEMSEKGWERWGLNSNQNKIVEPLIRIRRIENIAEATFDDIAIYILTKVEEAYSRCDSRDKCSNDASKVLHDTTEELSKLKNKLDRKKESHKSLYDQLSDVIDKIDAMQASARTEESQEIYDTVAKIIMPKVDSITEEQFLAEMKKIGYKPHLETNHEYWYRVYEGKIRDRSKRYERKYEVIGSADNSKSTDPDKKLKSAKKRSKAKGMLSSAKNKLTQQGLNMTQVFMHSMMGMIMGKMGVKVPNVTNQSNSNTVRDDEEDDDFGKLKLGSRSSKSNYSSSGYGSNYNKYGSGSSYNRYRKYGRY